LSRKPKIQRESRPRSTSEKLKTHEREYFVDLSFSPVRDANGEANSVIAVYRDISERVKS
jgi:PAS domain S-box-containing protein